MLSGYPKSLIKPDRITIAGILKQQGYTTGYIGKWHLGWDWDIKKEDSVLNKNDRTDGEKEVPGLDLDQLRQQARARLLALQQEQDPTPLPLPRLAAACANA